MYPTTFPLNMIFYLKLIPLNYKKLISNINLNSFLLVLQQMYYKRNEVSTLNIKEKIKYSKEKSPLYKISNFSMAFIIMSFTLWMYYTGDIDSSFSTVLGAFFDMSILPFIISAFLLFSALYSLFILSHPGGLGLLFLSLATYAHYDLWSSASQKILEHFFNKPADFINLSDSFYHYIEYLNMLFLFIVFLRILFLQSFQIKLNIIIFSLLIIALNIVKSYYFITYETELKLYFFITTFIYLITLSLENSLHTSIKSRFNGSLNFIIFIFFVALSTVFLDFNFFNQYILWFLVFIVAIATLIFYNHFQENSSIFIQLLFPYILTTIGIVTYTHLQPLAISFEHKILFMVSIVLLMTYSIKYFTNRGLIIISIFSTILFFQDKNTLIVIDLFMDQFNSLMSIINPESFSASKAWIEVRNNMFFKLFNPDIKVDGTMKIFIVLSILTIIPGIVLLAYGIVEFIWLSISEFGSLLLIYLVELIAIGIIALLFIVFFYQLNRLLNLVGNHISIEFLKLSRYVPGKKT